MLALLYDVHGNLRALEAVLADARAAGAERFLLGGDYAAFGPEPAETLAALRELSDAVWIRGNWERWCAHPDEALDNAVVQGALAAALEALGTGDVTRLGDLPEQAVGESVRYCHGSPKSDMESWRPEPQAGEEAWLAGATEPRIVFGHTHLQFRRQLGDTELVNPGSVGLPWDGDPRAAYALVGEDGALQLRRVAYDAEAAAAALTERYGKAEWAVTTAERLRTARF
jgi:predicted phosphodiesterase